MEKNRTLRRNIERKLKKILSKNTLELDKLRHQNCLDEYQQVKSSEFDRIIDAAHYTNKGDLYYDE